MSHRNSGSQDYDCRRASRALAGLAIAGVLCGCSNLTPSLVSSATPIPTPSLVSSATPIPTPLYGEAPRECSTLNPDTPLAWAGHERVRQVLHEGTPEDVVADNPYFHPGRAISQEVVGDIYVQAGSVSDPRWLFCVISDDGTVYGFWWFAAWEPPSQ